MFYLANISRAAPGLVSTTTDETNFYEELLVNPTLLKLATQRAHLDCEGLRYIAIGYGKFVQLIMSIRDGHVSLGVSRKVDAGDLASRVQSLLGARSRLDAPCAVGVGLKSGLARHEVWTTADRSLTPPTFRWHGLRVNEQSFPVTVLVKRPNGSVEPVRVGTAVRSGDGFRLSLGELSIGAAADPAPARATRDSDAAGGDRGMVFPPYGRSKGAPIVGASMNDLEFYISGSRRSLDDPTKSRWHDKERVLLAAMEAEVARQNGGGGGGNDFTLPEYDEAPPHSDDDIPF